MGLFRNLFSQAFASTRCRARGTKGARAYVMGDIHGRLDLLDSMLSVIEADLNETDTRQNYLIFVGDLVDRGPASSGVVARLCSYRNSAVRPVFLCGNHEEILLRVLDGEEGLSDSWLRYGGAECAASYGVDPNELKGKSAAFVAKRLRAAIPDAHVSFLRGLGDTFRFGDYLIVHAGLRPGVPLADQSRNDMRWIREPFLSDDMYHGHMVVHGHTVVVDVEERANRIAIDTGAYRSGKLSALVLEDEHRRVLTVQGVPADPRQGNSPLPETVLPKEDGRL